MPSHRYADRPAPQPPDRGSVDALITQARRLRGGIDAVRGETADDAGEQWADPRRRWQRALCDLATQHLDDLEVQLSQLREGLPEEPQSPAASACGPGPAPYSALPTGSPACPLDGSLASRVGSAEWNLLTDEVTWSDELFEIFGRSQDEGPMSLDELPSWVLPEDQPALAAAVTDCLVDGKPMDIELRVVRPDKTVRTLRMMGEPTLDADGNTAAMWAVLRDIHELRRSQHAVTETRDALRQERHIAHTERRLAVELQEAVMPPWRGSLRLPRGGPAALDLAAHYLPSATNALIGGGWYDALELPDGAALLTAGDLTGHGVAATSGVATLLGAVRGMAMTGVTPGPLLGHLNHLLDTAAQPALGSALCCRYQPRDRSFSWAQAAHPAPLLFRGGEGRVLPTPAGVLLGATADASYSEHTEQLRPGDLLVLYTDGLLPRSATPVDRPTAAPVRDTPLTAEPLLALAPRFARARTAQECVRAVVEECGGREREDDACLLVARISG